MTEHATTVSADVPGQPFYEKTRQHLKDLLIKKRMLERSLAAQEEAIYKKETDYLEETPNGNIITGFEAYTKATAPGAARRKAAVSEQNRVFSRSSVSFGVNVDSPPLSSSAQSTPIQPTAPTPVTANFVKAGQTMQEGASNHATPTSTGSGTGMRAGAGGGTATVKKSNNKRPSGEDSESEAKDVKKARTNAGPTRK